MSKNEERKVGRKEGNEEGRERGKKEGNMNDYSNLTEESCKLPGKNLCTHRSPTQTPAHHHKYPQPCSTRSPSSTVRANCLFKRQKVRLIAIIEGWSRRRNPRFYMLARMTKASTWCKSEIMLSPTTTPIPSFLGNSCSQLPLYSSWYTLLWIF